MADECHVCPALRSENRMLRLQLDHLRDKFGALLGAVQSLQAWLTAETDEPTMPRHQVIPAVINRLELMSDEAQERR